jgi:hypothetical protein
MFGLAIFDVLDDIFFTATIQGINDFWLRFKFLEEAAHKVVVLLVKVTDFIFGIFVVWNFEDALVVNHASKNCISILITWFLCLMMTLKMSHKWFLVPKFKKLGSAVILQCV